MQLYSVLLTLLYVVLILRSTIIIIVVAGIHRPWVPLRNAQTASPSVNLVADQAVNKLKDIRNRYKRQTTGQALRKRDSRVT